MTKPVSGSLDNILCILSKYGVIFIFISYTKLIVAINCKDSPSKQIVIFDTYPDFIVIMVDKVGKLIKVDSETGFNQLIKITER